MQGGKKEPKWLRIVGYLRPDLKREVVDRVKKMQVTESQFCSRALEFYLDHLRKAEGSPVARRITPGEEKIIDGMRERVRTLQRELSNSDSMEGVLAAVVGMGLDEFRESLK